MFCRECGSQNPDGSKFCEQCGTPFSSTSASSPGVTSDSASGTYSSSTSPRSDPLLGQTIGGTYRIDSVLGRGGMGVVYKALNVRLDLPVAVKVLASNLAHDNRLMQRFEAEARTQARLRHPNIIAVQDFIIDGGINAIIMEYVEGMTLEEIIHRQTGPMQPARIIGIMMPVLEAVGLAHEQGIVHRDIKPSNIMLTQVGTREIPKVMDFGIAKVFAEGGMQTATSSKLGTLHYMSPEQCASPKDVDARSDIYSLGVTLYEMATGKVPFQSESELELMLAHRDSPVPPPREFYPGVTEEVERVILRALEKDPAARFQDVEAFTNALTSCARDGSVPSVPIPTPRPVTPATKTVVETEPVSQVSPAAAQRPHKIKERAVSLNTANKRKQKMAWLTAVLVTIAIVAAGILTYKLTTPKPRQSIQPHIAAAPAKVPPRSRPEPVKKIAAEKLVKTASLPPPKRRRIRSAKPKKISSDDLLDSLIDEALGKEPIPTRKQIRPTAKPRKIRASDVLDPFSNNTAPTARRDPPAAKPSPPAVKLKKTPTSDFVDPFSDNTAPEAKPKTPSLPEQLSMNQIRASMNRIKGLVQSCYDHYQVEGRANVKLIINNDGTPANLAIRGKFFGTDTGACVLKAAKKVRFPKFSGKPMTIKYPFLLQ